MSCDEQTKDRVKNSYREFIPVQSRSLPEVVGGVGISRRIEVAPCRIGGHLLLGTFEYSQVGRVGSRRVASDENGAAGDCADGRRTANAGRRSVRHMLVVVPRLRARISPSYRNGGRPQSDSRVACFETCLGVPDRSGSGPREGDRSGPGDPSRSGSGLRKGAVL